MFNMICVAWREQCATFAPGGSGYALQPRSPRSFRTLHCDIDAVADVAAGSDRHRSVDQSCTSDITCLRATGDPRSRLYLGARLLGMGRGRRRLLLGAWHVGPRTGPWFAVDTWLLGMA